jgi:hypothetical protein
MLKSFICALQLVRYGAPYRKSTTLYVSGDFLDRLSLRCTRDHKHVNLSGWKDKSKPEQQNMTTRGSAAYPSKMCSAWAKLVKQAIVARDA